MSDSAALLNPDTTGTAEWLSVGERGSILGMQFFFFLCTVFGRRVARAFLRPVVLYYALVSGSARRASRAFLLRFFPRVTFGMTYRHLLNFAEAVLDRVFFLRGQLQHVQATSSGFEHLRQLRAAGRGAVLLGAHLGSVEAMRVLAEGKELPVNILVYSGNARMINALMRKLNPRFNGRVIELRPGDVDALLRARELVDAGEVVAILGDRVGLNEKHAVVDFLGSPARLPTGPYLLAAMLKCPVFLTVGLYRSPNGYDCFCEPFAEQIELPRAEREAALASYAQQYAKRLEYYCRLSPYNWFNFYDFWNLQA